MFVYTAWLFTDGTTERLLHCYKYLSKNPEDLWLLNMIFICKLNTKSSLVPLSQKKLWYRLLVQTRLVFLLQSCVREDPQLLVLRWSASKFTTACFDLMLDVLETEDLSKMEDKGLPTQQIYVRVKGE